MKLFDPRSDPVGTPPHQGPRYPYVNEAQKYERPLRFLWGRKRKLFRRFRLLLGEQYHGVLYVNFLGLRGRCEVLRKFSKVSLLCLEYSGLRLTLVQAEP